MEAHEVLGIPKDASEEQVRAAYKALALKWHPDRQLKNREEATSKFVERTELCAALARARREAKATQDCPTSDPLPASSSTPASIFASSKQPTRSTRSQRSPSQSPTSSRSPSSSPTHSSQPSRTSSLSQSHEDTPRTSISSDTSSAPISPSESPTSSRSPSSPPTHSSQPPLPPSSHEDTPRTSISSDTSSAPISPSDSFINVEDPAPEEHEDILRKKSNPQINTRNPNPKTFLHRPDDSPTREPDFMGVILRPEQSILRGAGADAPKKWVHVLNMTLEEIYQGKTFHFRLIRYKLSGKKSIVPLVVTVPLGSRDGTEVIVTNVGNERKDGTRQDIIFLVKASRHKRFSRVHDDLRLEVRLPWVDSLEENEGEVRLNGIDGKEYAFHVDFCKTGLLTGTAIIPNAGIFDHSVHLDADLIKFHVHLFCERAA
ncbi:DnaJ-domain-containing protein [Phlegmacium glaucopus]|nr:DnaJ-domain-containing protein [Phlegmacium glaucopus]